MKKVLVVLALSTVIAFLGCNTQNASANEDDKVILLTENYKVIINKTVSEIVSGDLTARPYSENEKIYIPVDIIQSVFAGEVNWNAGKTKIDIVYNGKSFSLDMNSDILISGSNSVSLGIKPVLKNNIAYIPIRNLVENILGKELSWHKSGLIGIGKEKVSFEKESDVSEYLNMLSGLEVVGSKENLDKLVKEYNDSLQNGYNDGAVYHSESENVEGAGESADERPMATSKDGSAYSETNIQVAGVDEADMIKTDGKYIYYIQNGSLYIVLAENPSKLILSQKIKFYNHDEEIKNPKDMFYPTEMFLDGDTLTLIGNYSVYNQDETPNTESKMTEDVANYYYNDTKTRVLVYDIKDRTNIKEKRSFFIDGYYVTSRKVSDIVYLVTNTSNYGVAPYYSDLGEAVRELDYNKMFYFPNTNANAIVTVSSIDTKNVSKEANVQSYLGNAQTIYVSENNVYLAFADYNFGLITESSSKTNIIKIGIKDGSIIFRAKGEVDGYILNQFSLDEYKGNLRVVTTSSTYKESEVITSNNLFILNEDLNIIGKINDLAKGEQIKSARSLGDKIYMVTFEQIDPLFVIDASDPTKPVVLGELKIPGYSTYLHPVGEKHLLGFGYDTWTEKDLYGNEFVRNAGMKMAMFDISDFKNPKELFVEKIGDDGTYSDIINNHKALMYDKDRNLIAFPIYKVEKSFSGGYENIRNFNGAEVYTFDLLKGFSFKGEISHKKSDIYYAPSINRIVYIKDTLFAASERYISATNLKTMKEISTLDLFK